MHFTKMQGLGNDYLYVYGEVPDNIRDICVKLSDRHFGAGSDGMIYIVPSSIADFSMRIFNADGSEAKMCGNGIRCVGKYVYEKGYTDKTILMIDTLSGIRKLDLHIREGKVKTVTVDMGITAADNDLKLTVRDEEVLCTPVSIGNPHIVLFTDNAEQAPVTSVGPAIEHHKNFPDGVNVEFVQILSENSLRMRVWERGSGVTMACGTGACAAVAAAVRKGYCHPDEPVSVLLDGGKLEIVIASDGRAYMTGPAVTVYEAEAEI